MEVSLLIQQSYRDAQLLAEEGESATSAQLTTGVRLLNRILRKISTDGFEIPLITEETFNLTTGVSILELPGWSKLEKVQYYLGDVLVDIVLQDLNRYYNNAVIRTSSGVPVVAYPKRTPTGITLNVFLKPDQDYEILIRGYKQLTDVVLSDEIALNSIAGFMEDYIGYLLSIALQIDSQLSTISPWLVLEKETYETKYERLKFTRIDKRIDKMGDSDGDGRSIIAYGVSHGWTW